LGKIAHWEEELVHAAAFLKKFDSSRNEMQHLWLRKGSGMGQEREYQGGSQTRQFLNIHRLPAEAASTTIKIQELDSKKHWGQDTKKGEGGKNCELASSKPGLERKG